MMMKGLSLNSKTVGVVLLRESKVVHNRPRRDSEVPLILLPNNRHDHRPYGGDKVVVCGAQADGRCPCYVALMWCMSFSS